MDQDNNPYAPPIYLDLKFRDERASRIFYLNKTTGLITVDPKRDTSNVGTYEIEVTVDDQRGRNRTYKFSVEIVNNDPPVEFVVVAVAPVVEEKKIEEVIVPKIEVPVFVNPI